jgi:PIN domain nuclease of toxin-antitoxin system
LILLDTQSLVWFVQGDTRLGVLARRSMIDEAEAGGVLISPISFWEVSMLVEKARISLGRDTAAWVEAVLDQPGFKLEPMKPAVAVDAGRLPGQIHGDPADRLIIATARHRACPVLTTDRRILGYAEQGHVQAADARR